MVEVKDGKIEVSRDADGTWALASTELARLRIDENVRASGNEVG